ncbi:hypothetical protein KCP73_24575 [Salmonella enterica subsp. enterica]|nr:hypothetical protein KCP73_24575 [Salmonella enterica subsp. enterica]
MQALAGKRYFDAGRPGKNSGGGIPADYVTQMLALMEISKCGARRLPTANAFTVCAAFWFAEQPA